MPETPKTVRFTDPDGNITTVQGVTNIEIIHIDKNEEWKLTTADNTPAVYVTPHVGGRPDDR